MTLHESPLHFAVHTKPGTQGAAAAFLAAWDGTAVSANAVIATAPTSRILAIDFILRTPLILFRQLTIARWNFAHKVVVAFAHRRRVGQAALRFAAKNEHDHETQHRTLPDHAHRQPAAARRPHLHDIRQGGRRAR